MNKTCLVCNTNALSPIYNETLLKCNICGFITANMEIDSETLQQTYTEKPYLQLQFTLFFY